MKFLLAAVNAKYIHSNPALHSLRSYAVREKPDLARHVELAEYTINQQMQDILADIYKRRPDVVAFSCYIWNWNLIRALSRELEKLLPDLPIWLGGPEVSYDAEKLLAAYPQFRGIMLGEGEETFLELTEYYRSAFLSRKKEQLQMKLAAYWPGAVKQADLFSIAGLVFRDPITKKVVRTARRKLLPLNDLPFYYRKEEMGSFENRIVYYESSRGCPFRCSYCLSSLDKRVRLRDIDLVCRELQFFLDEEVPQVKFIDRTFNSRHGHAKAIWGYIQEHDNGVTNFHFEVAADLLDREELELLGRMRPGLVQLEIGVQSTNPDTIQEIRRQMDLEKVEQNVRTLREGGNIHLHLDLIAGLPREDYDSFARSFNEVYALRPEQLQLGFLKVLKGSPMHEKAAEYGLGYLEDPPYEVLYTSWLPFDKVLRLKKIETVLEVYYNSGQFSHTLPLLEQAFETPFALYEALADFYEQEGFFAESPARAHRYQALLEFARSRDGEREALYRETLLFDLYLREKLKSRPEFAPDPKEWQEEAWAFYEKEEAAPCLLTGYDGYTAKQLCRMTHIERFAWPVWKDAQELAAAFRGPADGQGGYVLFDYQARNPLTRDARVAVLEIEEKRKPL